MAHEKVRLGSIGVGHWGGTMAAAVARSGAGEIVRCFDASEAARAAFAGKVGCRPAWSLEELLGDREVEGVIIATPHSTHADIVCQAASAGKHIFVEKPLALTAADARRAMDAAAKAGRPRPAGGSEGLEVVAVLQAIIESINTG